MKLDGKYKEMYLKTTNSIGKEVACQTVKEGEEHVEVPVSDAIEREEKDLASRVKDETDSVVKASVSA